MVLRIKAYQGKLNNELLGIVYMVIAQFSFATNDALVKHIYQSFDELAVLNQIIFLIHKRKFYPLEFFIDIKSELNLKLIFFIVLGLIKIYFRIGFLSIIRLIKNPKKIFKLKKFLKQL